MTTSRPQSAALFIRAQFTKDEWRLLNADPDFRREVHADAWDAAAQLATIIFAEAAVGKRAQGGRTLRDLPSRKARKPSGRSLPRSG